MTSPTGLDSVHKKLNDISRLLDRHGKRLDTGGERYLHHSMGMRAIESGVDRANSRLDLIDERLEAIMTLLRKEQ